MRVTRPAPLIPEIEPEPTSPYAAGRVFDKLIAARERHDSIAAKRLITELRAHGWSVCPIEVRPTFGRGA